MPINNFIINYIFNLRLIIVTDIKIRVFHYHRIVKPPK